jgi:serine/threonine protein kinase
MTACGLRGPGDIVLEPGGEGASAGRPMPEFRPDSLDAVDPTVEIGSPVQHLQATGLRAGAVLESRYQIEAAIGQGGSGQVFRAWDRVLGEPIALKILLPDRAREKTWIKRLAREVKVARAIRHPNICRVFDLANADGHWFVSMELASGGTLRDTLHSGRSRALAERLADARAICAGLAAIHVVGITHRDVTPQNVLRMADGRLVISDFGLAVESDDTTVQGGTPRYMAPEAVMGQRLDQRSDVWQLGSILHEVFFDRRPAWRSDGGRIVLVEPAGPGASAIYKKLGRLCRDCLAQNPGDRPSDAMEVSVRLAAAELGRSGGAVGRLIRQRWKWMLGAGLALLVSLTVLRSQMAAPASRTDRSSELSPGDRRLLRSIAETLQSEGRIEEAHRLNRLAEPDRQP